MHAEAAAGERDHHPTGWLALTFQEVLTVIVRLRTNRQVPHDARAFRDHVEDELSSAGRNAKSAGCGADDVRLAFYACVAFLDETVQNSGRSVLADWQPLQQQVFGDLLAGETFYDNLDTVLSRRGSPAVADVLEVYLLCMQLGFRGKYDLARGSGERRRLMTETRNRIASIRGEYGDISSSWAPPNETVPRVGDPWARRLLIATGASVAIVGALFLIFTFFLRPGIEDIQRLGGLS